jgi:hypothetical protein
MIVPPFIGQEVIRSAAEITDGKGYVKVRDTYQAAGYDNVYAVGIAAAVDVPWQTATPVGIPKTGFPTERRWRRGTSRPKSAARHRPRTRRSATCRRCT